MFKFRGSILLLFVVEVYLAAFSYQQECRVLADCDDGTATWKDLAIANSASRPGKRGATGPRGEKGEPGTDVDVAELKKQLKAESNEPTLYFYTKSLTWNTGKFFCDGIGKSLCSFDQICIPENGSRKLIIDVLPGDHWVPVINENNEWVEIGNHHGIPCILHGPGWGPPSWGTTDSPAKHKGQVFCCASNRSQEIVLPNMKYQYIGKATTYASSESHCNSQERRLCYSSEICAGGNLRFGAAPGDHWAAVKDRRNDWIQVGKTGTCGMHAIKHGLPSWGERRDGSLLNHVGYVFCCKKGSRK